ncbi:hypothetical protein O59_002172 [Cellvibrio sp. BR]|nr:hypothetical protein O59_002172 [Cellvibrio sp. BR]
MIHKKRRAITDSPFFIAQVSTCLQTNQAVGLTAIESQLA